MKKWTLKTVQETLKINVKGYGDAIAVAALYKRLYGKFPEIGLSGAQAGMAEAVFKKLPTPLVAKEALLIGYDPAHGSDTSCRVVGKRSEDGTITIMSVEYGDKRQVPGPMYQSRPGRTYKKRPG